MNNSSTSELEVQWGKERMLFTLPPPPATLLDLKQLISERTGLQPSQMKLISHGFTMKQDNVSLATYGLYDQEETKTASKPSGFFRAMAPKKRGPQRIALIASPETQATVSDRAGLEPRAQQETSRSFATSSTSDGGDESSTLHRIAAIRDEALRSHLPTIEALEQRKPLTDHKAVARANELLLQALLAFDSLRLDPQWSSARSARKEGVKTVQGLLDRLDQARGAV